MQANAAQCPLPLQQKRRSVRMAEQAARSRYNPLQLRRRRMLARWPAF